MNSSLLRRRLMSRPRLERTRRLMIRTSWLMIMKRNTKRLSLLISLTPKFTTQSKVITLNFSALRVRMMLLLELRPRVVVNIRVTRKIVML